ncbi:hypothetical protein HanRHA438_Chr04g0193811 [Helianthus annuus]|nr:hypothetical protein HanRHA438_Chr04g0193811 [Helianthus annuus]
MTELNSINDAFHLSESQIMEIVDFFQSGRFPTTEEYIKWDLWSKAFYLKVHSSCGNKPPLSYQSLGQQQEIMFGDCSFLLLVGFTTKFHVKYKRSKLLLY